MSSALLYGIGREQHEHTAALGNAYLEGVTASLAPALVHRDVWDAYDTLDRSRQAFGTSRLRLAVALLPDGHVLASTDPRRVPVDSLLSVNTSSGGGSPVGERGDVLQMARDIGQSGVNLGRVTIELDTSPERLARERIGLILVTVNAGVAIGCAALGWWLARKMLRPVRVLTEQLGRGAARAPQPIDPASAGGFSREFELMFGRYNEMVRAAGERQALAARLAEEERLATLGALAGSMAHEVNNPLGGMLTALDTLAVHGSVEDVRTQSLGLIRRGLEDIRTIVRATLVTYKSGEGSGRLAPESLDDLRYLVGPEAARREVHLAWENRLSSVAIVDASAVRQAVLNVLLNAVAASSPRGVVRLTADLTDGMLRIQVGDDGPGLPPAAAELLISPGVKPPTGSVGLGLWTAVRAVQSSGGTIRRVSSAVGTALVLLFPEEARGAAAT